MLFPHEPLHLLVRSRLDRRWQPDLITHSCTKNLSPGSFFSLGEGLFVTSPELTFIQVACRLSLESLIHFGMMLCGMYCREPIALAQPDGCSEPLRDVELCSAKNGGLALRPSRSRRLKKRVPLTSADDLRAYAEGVRSMQGRSLNGVRLALRVLPYVIDRSRSPMESALAMALCLPRRFGGFALPLPSLNAPVRLTPRGDLAGGVRWDVSGSPYFECDLVWEEHRVIAEYHGDDGHFTREGTAKDARKANILRGEGYKYYVATIDTMSDLKFPEFAHRIRLDLQRKFRTNVNDFEERSNRLRASLQRDYLLDCRIEDLHTCERNDCPPEPQSEFVDSGAHGCGD